MKNILATLMLCAALHAPAAMAADEATFNSCVDKKAVEAVRKDKVIAKFCQGSTHGCAFQTMQPAYAEKLRQPGLRWKVAAALIQSYDHQGLARFAQDGSGTAYATLSMTCEVLGRIGANGKPLS